MIRPGPNILVVDDDPSIREALREYLEGFGFSVRTAASGREMDAELNRNPADLIILDLMMPGEDGLAICRRLGPEAPPIIMLSAVGAVTDRIVGLELGAADYLPKPFDPRELLARVRATLRKRRTTPAHRSSGHLLMFDGWRLEIIDRTLAGPAGRLVNLTRSEFALLRAFAEHPRRLLSRNQLLDFVGGSGAEPFDRAIDLQVSRLRRKLKDGSPHELIETVRGEGYMFSAEVRRG